MYVWMYAVREFEDAIDDCIRVPLERQGGAGWNARAGRSREGRQTRRWNTNAVVDGVLELADRVHPHVHVRRALLGRLHARIDVHGREVVRPELAAREGHVPM